MMESRVVEEFLKHLREVPYDLFVPSVEKWVGVGLQPIPQQHYVVEYHADAAAVLRNVLNGNSALYPLERDLHFQLDADKKTLHVLLRRTRELSR